VDHIEITALELDRHHFKLLVIGVSAEIDDADRSLPKPLLGRLLKANAIVGDNMADAVL
jgi:hypothetical protein